MKNILLISNSLGLGGTEKTLQIYAKYLNKKKFNVFVCGFFSGGEREKLIKPHVKKIFLAQGNVEKIKKFIAQNKIEIVYFLSTDFSGKTPTFFKTLELFRFLKNQTLKQVQDNTDVDCHAELGSASSNQPIKVIETSQFAVWNPQIDALLDKKLFVSRTCLQKYFWKNKFKIKKNLSQPKTNFIQHKSKQVDEADKYNFLYNPLDIAEMKKHTISKKEIADLKNKLGIKPNEIVLGRIGRPDPWKWDSLTIKVAQELKKRKIPFKFIVRSAPKKIINQINNSFFYKSLKKHFIFLPLTPDEKEICKTYQTLDIYVHFSFIGETFGCALAEAMFFKKPIITSETDYKKWWIPYDRDNAQTEIVENNKNGYVENNVKKIADLIIKLSSNKKLYKKIGESNYKKSTTVFNAKNLVKKLGRYLIN